MVYSGKLTYNPKDFETSLQTAYGQGWIPRRRTLDSPLHQQHTFSDRRGPHLLTCYTRLARGFKAKDTVASGGARYWPIVRMGLSPKTFANVVNVLYISLWSS
jgi:hypothetical protein